MDSTLLRPLLKSSFLVWTFAFTLNSVFSQTPESSFPNAISSDAFLSGMHPTSLAQATSKAEFPAIVKEGWSTEALGTTIPVGYTTELAASDTQAVSTAQFESPAVSNPIGTGVSNLSLATVPSPTNISQPSYAIQPSSQIGAATRSDWRDRLGLDRDRPNFQAGFEAIALYRSNDAVGPFSQNEELSRFDQDLSGRYTFSRLLGGIERIELKFTGPFHWEKQSTALGPVDSNFSPSIATSFDQADQHQLSHQIRLSSYELNRCWSSDELSTFYYGLRFVDHAERYRLDATRAADKRSFQLGTNNFLAGSQIGLNLHKPISQRLTAGVEGSAGLYGNFANGFLNAIDASTTLLDTSDKRLRLTSMLTIGGRLNYRISQNILASSAYEYWYFPGLATAADQHLSTDAQLANWTLRTGDDQLFRGWSFGLSARF